MGRWVCGASLGFGLLHAFESDHVAAVTTLVAQGGGPRRAALLGASWGLGHAVPLVLAGGTLISLGIEVPAPDRRCTRPRRCRDAAFSRWSSARHVENFSRQKGPIQRLPRTRTMARRTPTISMRARITPSARRSLPGSRRIRHSALSLSPR
ncbi:MAG: hypothetical protein U0165_18790 [Polyangiaceae bacterium]